MAAPQFVHIVLIVPFSNEALVVPFRSTSRTSCLFGCFHLYTLNARPRTVAVALIEPVTIPTIEPVDNFEEDVDNADVEVPEDVATGPLVDRDTTPPPSVSVAEFVWTASNIKPLTCTPSMTVGVDTSRLVVV